MSGTQCFSVVWPFPGTGLSRCGIADVELGWAGANFFTVVLIQGYGKAPIPGIAVRLVERGGNFADHNEKSNCPSRARGEYRRIVFMCVYAGDPVAYPRKQTNVPYPALVQRMSLAAS
jgi:hypothetical protein